VLLYYLWAPPKHHLGLCQVSFSPAQSWNSLRAFIICCNEAGYVLLNRMRSSANIRCVSPSCLQFGWNLKSCCWLACFSSLERYSIESTNNSGDRGSPYRKPFPPSNGSLWCPFMWIINYTEVTHAIIHLVNCKGNFNAVNISWTNPQWTKSKALCKSILRRHLWDMFFLW